VRLLHFALTGTMVGGVERYLATLLGAAPGELEHLLVYEGGDRHPVAGRWPAIRAPWTFERRTQVAALPAGLGDGVPIFHFPPAPAVHAGLARSGRPWAVFCHDHRWWCPSGTRFHARLGKACDVRASGPACALRYHALGCGSVRPSPTVHGFARAGAARVSLHDAPAVLTASAYMRDEAVRHGARPDRTHVLPLPVAAGAPTGTGRDPAPTILFASRLTPEKGPFVLLDAFARMQRRVRLEIAGTGIGAADVAHAVRRHPRSGDIQLLGELSSDGVRARMRAAHVVSVPSIWPEPFGLVGIEALAEGQPVVASATGGTTDWAREELGVIPVPPGDPQRLADALDSAIADPVWADRASSVGAGWVAVRHGLDAHVGRLRALLDAGAAT